MSVEKQVQKIQNFRKSQSTVDQKLFKGLFRQFKVSLEPVESQSKFNEKTTNIQSKFCQKLVKNLLKVSRKSIKSQLKIN